MIHIAPCSCELHVRIRELEAELAYFRRNTDRGILKAFDEVKARAEKAEARVAELEDALRMASLAWERKLEAREREAD